MKENLGNLKLKRRVDWYMDSELFLKYQRLAFLRGFSTVQKLIKQVLDEEFDRQGLE